MNENMCVVPESTWKERNRALNSLWLPVVTFFVPLCVAFTVEWLHAKADDDLRVYFFSLAVVALFFALLAFGALLLDADSRRKSMNSFTSTELVGWQARTILQPPNTALTFTNVESAAQAPPTAGPTA
jgi:hypothetical protein